MDSFRWILVGIGILLLIAVYVFYLLEKRFPHWFGGVKEEKTAKEDAITEEEIIYLNLKSRDGEIEGADLIRAMQKYNMTHGDMNIFHRLTEGSKQPLFSVANMIEPGSFDLDTLATMKTPGITLFLQLPTAIDGLQAFDDFVHTAERLAVELGGQLQDQKHCVITHQALMQIRENIASSRLHTQVAS